MGTQHTSEPGPEDEGLPDKVSQWQVKHDMRNTVDSAQDSSSQRIHTVSDFDSQPSRSRIVAVFGSTGTAGSAAVQACLADSKVSEVRAITRRPLGISDPKLDEVICSDFADLSGIARYLKGIDSCFFCLGISATKVPEEERYREIHVTYALSAARTLLTESPDASFVYLSGGGAKRNSRMMWARVKAEAEDLLSELGLARCLCVRPGYILPMAPTGFARWVLQPLLMAAPLIGIRAADLGRAMLKIGLDRSLGSERLVLENRDIRKVAG